MLPFLVKTPVTNVSFQWVKKLRLQRVLLKQSANLSTKHHPKTRRLLVSDDEVDELNKVFPEVVQRVIDGCHLQRNLSYYADFMEQLLHYNVMQRHNHRAFTTVAAYKSFEKTENLTAENIKLANVMGWIAELAESAYFVGDDLADGAPKRHGYVSWHVKVDRGMYAMFDANTIWWSACAILSEYFHDHPNFKRIALRMSELGTKSIMGETHDFHIANRVLRDLDHFTATNYNQLGDHKSSYCAFHTPIFLAMLLANVDDDDLLRIVNEFCIEIGLYFQIQNDYWDCFGASREGWGKVPEDIREGKCTWFAVKALERCDLAQRKLLEEHYGRDENESENIVLDLYRKLNLENVFFAYEDEMCKKFRRSIEEFPPKLPRHFFFQLCEQIVGRKVL